MLLTLRDNVIGRDAMDRAMREYARRWAFKHPTPGDFFRTVENVSGEDLSWFWSAFFYGTDVLDIAIDGVNMRTCRTVRASRTIALRRVTSIPFPGGDASANSTMHRRRTSRLPVEIWTRTDRYTGDVPGEAARWSACVCGPTPTFPTGTRRTTCGAIASGRVTSSRSRPVAESVPPIPAGAGQAVSEVCARVRGDRSL